MANPTVTIAGVDRTGRTKVDTVRIRKRLNDRSTMSCLLEETVGVYRPVRGNPIVVAHDGSSRFSGMIEEIVEIAHPGTEALQYALSCVDHCRICDRKLYAGSFENQSFYSIVLAIWSAKLSEEGVTLGTIENPGITITERMQDGLTPVTTWLNKLSTRTGYLWRIDENKALNFGPLTTSPAPFSITWTSGNWANLQIRRGMGDYRNRQYVRTEYRVTSLITENFVGDGATRDFFQLNYPFASTPTVTLNGAPQTVGRFGIDLTGFDFYYDVEGWGIHRYFSQSAPVVGAAIAVSFTALFSNTTMVHDLAEIAARAAVQGDSGAWEAIHEDRYIDTKEALDARAEGVLRQFGTLPTLIEFETDSENEPDSNDLAPGQRIDIDMTAGPHDVDDTYLIEGVESSLIAAQGDDIWKHRVECTSVEPFGRPTQVLERLVEATRIGPDPASIVGGASAVPASMTVQQETLTGDLTIDADNPPVADDGSALLLLIVTQDGTGGHLATLGSGFSSGASISVDPDAGQTTLAFFFGRSGVWSPAAPSVSH